jgi:hypothetical protein
MRKSLSQTLAKVAGPLSWALTAFVALQCAVSAIAMVRVVSIFQEMFKGIGVELPWPTRLLLATYYWSLPAFFLILVLLLIGKEFALLENRRKFVFTGEIFLAAVFTPGLVMLILYLPLFVLIRRLSDTN